VQLDITNPFFAAIYRGLEDVAQGEGALVLSGSSDADPDRERALIETLIARRVDGLVIASGRPDPALLVAELAHGTPMVFVDQDPAIDGVDVVRTDHHLGARMATEHLLAHGHRRVAFLGDSPHFYSADERRRGFVDVMAAAGLGTPWVVTNLTDPDQAATATVEVLGAADPPTALFTAQNFVTMGAVRTLHQLGLQHQVALVGFDDVEVATLVDPKITVVPQQPALLGKLAAERLFARLRGDSRQPERLVLAPELLVRGSGELTVDP
jgi:LacI family transcriptional regulator